MIVEVSKYRVEGDEMRDVDVQEWDLGEPSMRATPVSLSIASSPGADELIDFTFHEHDGVVFQAFMRDLKTMVDAWLKDVE